MRLLVLTFIFLARSARSLNFSAYYQYPGLTFQEDSKCAEEFVTLQLNAPDQLAHMIDATAKIPPGALGKREWIMGDYEECMAVEYENIRGKYCAYIFPLQLPTNKTLALSVCIPSGCQLEKLASGSPEMEALLGEMCHTADAYELETVDHVVSVVFIVILFLMVTSTLYDVYVDKTEKPKNRALVAFSVLTNIRKFVTVNKKSDQLSALNGIRFISMAWVLAGHRYVMMQGYPLINPDRFEEMKRSWYIFGIVGGRLAVDSFLFLGALLFSYLLFKNIKKNALTIYKVPLMYIHRILRILPSVIPLYLIHISIVPKLAAGPLWPSFFNQLKRFCHEYWWSFFLFIQNYVNYDKLCVTPTWYLAADMQLFLLAPILVFPMQYLILSNKKKLAFVYGGVMIVLFATLPYIPDYINESKNEYATHQRLATYMIGLVFGVAMVDVKKRMIKINKYLALLGWIIALGAMLSCLIWIAQFDFNYALYSWQIILMNAVVRPAWCVGLCWIVFACNTGNGSVINWFLSLSYFDYGAKLSYCMYIVHNTLIMMSIMFVRTQHYMSNYTTIYYFCGDFIFTSVVAFVWHLAFEAPAVVVEQMLFSRAPKKEAKDIAA